MIRNLTWKKNSSNLFSSALLRRFARVISSNATNKKSKMKHVAHKTAIHQGFSAINDTKFELPLNPEGINGVASGSFKYAK